LTTLSDVETASEESTEKPEITEEEQSVLESAEPIVEESEDADVCDPSEESKLEEPMGTPIVTQMVTS
jgi:hypothetical protein